jgi:hypothetical protein
VRQTICDYPGDIAALADSDSIQSSAVKSRNEKPENK